MTSPDALIAARRARAQRAHDQALTALKAMTRAREPITFAAVAARAGVSREFLYRHPDLADKIRQARHDTPTPLAPAPHASEGSPLSALRAHIRRLEAQHAHELSALRNENKRLRAELELALGQLIASDHPVPPTN